MIFLIVLCFLYVSPKMAGELILYWYIVKSPRLFKPGAFAELIFKKVFCFNKSMKKLKRRAVLRA